MAISSSGGGGRSLHGLLNSMELANKQDCLDFSQGHLNENKLLKYNTNESTSRSWASAQKPQLTLTPRSHLMKSSPDGRNAPMKDALLKFSIGTNGTIPIPLGKKPAKTRSSIKLKPRRKPSYLDDGILVEEFTPRDPVEDLKPSPRIEPSPRLSQDMIQTAITKRDQYLERQVWEHDLIKKQESREMNVLSGQKAVEHLEHKLRHQLSHLDSHGRGAEFLRLQVHRDIFDDLISESTVLGPMLKTIKTEYDNYMDYLLDNNPSQHKLLQEQISQMADRKLTPVKELRDQKEKLKSLEQEADELLMQNRRLREQIEKEKRGEYEPVVSVEGSEGGEQKLRSSPRRRDISDKIEDLRTNILGNLDEMQKIRDDLKRNFVPTTVVKQLDQCVKETEVENQNLARKNQLIEEDIAVITEKLANEIKLADTSDSDERRVWRRLLPKQTSLTTPRSASSISSTRAVVTPTVRETETESESEDDAKWNWYIS